MKTLSRSSLSLRCLRQMLSLIGLPKRTSFTPLLYTFSATICANIRIGSMKTTLISKSSWMINMGLKMIPHPSLRKMCTVPSIARLSFTWGSYRMSGSVKGWMRCSIMLTAITRSNSMLHWRLSMDPSHLDHPQCWVLMVLLCWQARTKSLADGLNTSTMHLTTLPPSMKRS